MNVATKCINTDLTFDGGFIRRLEYGEKQPELHDIQHQQLWASVSNYSTIKLAKYQSRITMMQEQQHSNNFLLTSTPDQQMDKLVKPSSLQTVVNLIDSTNCLDNLGQKICNCELDVNNKLRLVKEKSQEAKVLNKSGKNINKNNTKIGPVKPPTVVTVNNKTPKPAQQQRQQQKKEQQSNHPVVRVSRRDYQQQDIALNRTSQAYYQMINHESAVQTSKLGVEQQQQQQQQQKATSRIETEYVKKKNNFYANEIPTRTSEFIPQLDNLYSFPGPSKPQQKQQPQSLSNNTVKSRQFQAPARIFSADLNLNDSNEYERQMNSPIFGNQLPQLPSSPIFNNIPLENLYISERPYWTNNLDANLLCQPAWINNGASAGTANLLPQLNFTPTTQPSQQLPTTTTLANNNDYQQVPDEYVRSQTPPQTNRSSGSRDAFNYGTNNINEINVSQPLNTIGYQFDQNNRIGSNPFYGGYLNTNNQQQMNNNINNSNNGQNYLAEIETARQLEFESSLRMLEKALERNMMVAALPQPVLAAQLYEKNRTNMSNSVDNDGSNNMGFCANNHYLPSNDCNYFVNSDLNMNLNNMMGLFNNHQQINQDMLGGQNRIDFNDPATINQNAKSVDDHRNNLNDQFGRGGNFYDLGGEQIFLCSNLLANPMFFNPAVDFSRNFKAAPPGFENFFGIQNFGFW